MQICCENEKKRSKVVIVIVCYMQIIFLSIIMALLLHRPAIVVLLMSMVNDKQPFILRCSVLYCFVSFLYKNDLGQSQIIQTLLPSSAEGMCCSFCLFCCTY